MIEIDAEIIAVGEVGPALRAGKPTGVQLRVQWTERDSTRIVVPCSSAQAAEYGARIGQRVRLTVAIAGGEDAR